VDKRLLTSPKRSIDAGFNKLHNEKAKTQILKNQRLASIMLFDGGLVEADSYKIVSTGITLPA
jgi:hypothetical protein